MSLNIIPAALTDAAAQLSHLGDDLAASSATAARATTAIVPAAADEISAAVATLFGGVGATWQQLSTQAVDWQQRFAGLLSAAGQAYQETEVANAQLISRHPVGLGENLISFQTGQGITSSIPLDALLNLTNSSVPIVRYLDSSLLSLFYPGYFG